MFYASLHLQTFLNTRNTLLMARKGFRGSMRKMFPVVPVMGFGGTRNNLLVISTCFSLYLQCVSGRCSQWLLWVPVTGRGEV